MTPKLLVKGMRGGTYQNTDGGLFLAECTADKKTFYIYASHVEMYGRVEIVSTTNYYAHATHARYIN